MKHIKIIHTTDENDCETCGWNYEESYQVEYNGKLYGNTANAPCWGSENTTLDEVLLMFIEDIGFIVEKVELSNE